MKYPLIALRAFVVFGAFVYGATILALPMLAARALVKYIFGA